MKRTTILDIINNGSEYLTKHNVESARLNVELLLSKTLNLQRLQLYLKHDMPLGETELEHMRQLLRKRASGEPLQYLLNKEQFLSIEVVLNNSVLIPRPETELLAKKTEELIRQRSYKKILDIGTGSGCIAIYLAKCFPEAEIVAIDKSSEAIATAKQNAELNKTGNITFYQSDILKVAPKQRYDLIVSNPPYVSLEEYNQLERELYHEPKEALTDDADGLSFYRRFAEIFPSALSSGGAFLLELPANRETELKEIFGAFRIEFIKDFNGHARILLGTSN
ncbi:MAG: peptide chain release factor N(5)-glutamine methyltransferase [Bacteroidota bacterium]